jgi:calcineurin-like phosphoesterase family protein/CheY-like chemotaxis protein
MFDLLVIDDSDTWRDVVLETLDSICNCDFADTYEGAIKKIQGRNYKVICINWNFHSLHKGRKLLTLLRENYPDIPVALISGYLAGSLSILQKRYPNVKEVLAKGPKQPSEAPSELLQEFQTDLLEIIPRLVRPITEQASVPVIKKSPEKQRVFSWLHFSDLHIGCKESTQDWESLREALLADLEEHQQPVSTQSKRLAGVVFQPNMIFITGDIAYRASEEEYREADSLLKSIWKITGLGKAQTFVISGNHDVNRKAVEDDPLYDKVYEELANSQIDAEKWFSALNKWWQYPVLWELINKKFERYIKFVSNCTGIPTDKLYYAQSIQVSGMKLEIIGLNSALMSWRDGEDRERGLWIGKPQLDEIESVLSKDASFRIALVHHPREALHEHDVAWDRIEQRCSLLLHGHLHKLRIASMGEPEREHICLPGGSVHQSGIWHSQRYSYGQFNLGTRELDLYMRMTKPGEYPIYIRDNQTYPDAGADGHIRIKLRQKSL